MLAASLSAGGWDVRLLLLRKELVAKCVEVLFLSALACSLTSTLSFATFPLSTVVSTSRA